MGIALTSMGHEGNKITIIAFWLEERQRQDSGDVSELRAGGGHSVHQVQHCGLANTQFWSWPVAMGIKQHQYYTVELYT